MESRPLSRYMIAFLLAALGLCIMPAAAVHATGDNGNDNDGPVFLILSLAEVFDTPDLEDCECDECECYEECYYDECSCEYCECDEEEGSETIIIEIGKFLAGKDIPTSRFELKALLDEIVLPKGTEFEDLDGYEFTIIGSFDTFSPDTIHLVTPDEGEVPPAVQEAFFLASPFLTEDIEAQFPTTVEIAQFIFDTAVDINPDLAEQTSPQEILDNIFVTEEILECPPGDVACEADGDLYPHEPNDIPDRIFSYDLSIDEDGEITISMCIDVEIDIKPGSDPNSINLGSKGVIAVAILTTDAYDAPAETDRSTLKLGGVAAKKTSIEDVNNDGDDDVVAHFSVPALVHAGALTKDSTQLMLTGETKGDTCIEGFDSVRIVPPKGKKKKK